MIKVITYGTYDMLHYGHIRLLQRAKLLGDYLVVGVTSDDYDKTRGKINNKQSLMERIEAVRNTGYADEIVVEEYEGQKIDDIKRMGIDIFTVGSDWEGYFDYLGEYCKVIYLPRTEGISSSQIRTEKRKLRIGIAGVTSFIGKFINEAKFVNGVNVSGIYAPGHEELYGLSPASSYSDLLGEVDAVYVVSEPRRHYQDIKAALSAGRHVLCESPVALSSGECSELFSMARERGLILMEGIKTAYSTAYARLVLLAKSGKIGHVVSVDSVCTSLEEDTTGTSWNAMCKWGPTALLPVMQILGTGYRSKTFFTKFSDERTNSDAFTKIDFVYPSAVASIKIARAAKSEGTLIVSGTKGYIYVPAPWWKTDYFEVRYENQERNNRYFYQLEGEGIRYEIVVFAKSVELAGGGGGNKRGSLPNHSRNSKRLQRQEGHGNLQLIFSGLCPRPTNSANARVNG